MTEAKIFRERTNRTGNELRIREDRGGDVES